MHTVGFVDVLTDNAQPETAHIVAHETTSTDAGSVSQGTAHQLRHRIMTTDASMVATQARQALEVDQPLSDGQAHSGVVLAIQAVEKSARDNAGIGRWSAERPTLVKAGHRLSIGLSAGDLLVPLALPDVMSAQSWTIQDMWWAHTDVDYVELHAFQQIDQAIAYSGAECYPSVGPSPADEHDLAGTSITGLERLVPGQRLLIIPAHHSGGLVTCFEAHDYVQVIMHTTSPQTIDGMPLLMNVPSPHTPDGPEAPAIAAIGQWLSAGPPRCWAPVA